MTRAEWQKEMSQLGWEFAVLEQYILENRKELLLRLEVLTQVEEDLKD